MQPDRKRKLIIIQTICKKYVLDQSKLKCDHSEDSSSDEEIGILMTSERDHSAVKPVRVQLYMENVISNYNLVEFQSHFRMQADAFENIMRLIGPLLQNQGGFGRPTVDTRKQLLSVIWLLATPDSYRSVGDRFDLAKSSLFHSFDRVIHVLNQIAPAVIEWPTGNYSVTVQRAFGKTGLNSIIGIIDGTYIPIKAPKQHPNIYICRKKYHAITLQAVCDHRLKFTDCFAGYPSSVNDIRVFRNSDLYKAITNIPAQFFPNQEYIIADKAYPPRQWCISPYINRGGLTARQTQFNTALSKIRQTIERTFALFKGQFRRFKYLDMNRVDLIPATILAGCVLYNLCLKYTDEKIEDYIAEGLRDINNEIDGEERQENQQDYHGEEDEAGFHRRDRIMMNLPIPEH